MLGAASKPSEDVSPRFLVRFVTSMGFSSSSDHFGCTAYDSGAEACLRPRGGERPREEGLRRGGYDGKRAPEAEKRCLADLSGFSSGAQNHGLLVSSTPEGAGSKTAYRHTGIHFGGPGKPSGLAKMIGFVLVALHPGRLYQPQPCLGPDVHMFGARGDGP